MAEITVLLEDTGLSAEMLKETLGDSVGEGIEIVVTYPGHMRVLNRVYRHIDRSTDVLSFDLSTDPGSGPEGTIFVDGRLYPPMRELLERIFHGCLHLSGMTHDTEEDALIMARKVDELVNSVLKGGEGQ